MGLFSSAHPRTCCEAVSNDSGGQSFNIMDCLKLDINIVGRCLGGLEVKCLCARPKVMGPSPYGAIKTTLSEYINKKIDN